MRKKIGLAVLLAALSGVASAHETCKVEHFLWFTFDVCKPDHADNRDRGDHRNVGERGDHRNDHILLTAKAPEIDSASAIAGLTLALGGLAVMRGRRRSFKV